MADSSGTLKTQCLESIERLKREKRNAKARLTRERNKLYELISSGSTSKNTIRRYINKIKSEFIIIEKLLNKLKETFIFENIAESEIEVEKIGDEIEEIGDQVDVIIKEAETHIKERLERGETESSVISLRPSGSTHSEYELQQQSELQAANKRVLTLQEEEKQKEGEFNRTTAEFELAKQRTDEARKISCIIDVRSHNATPKTVHDSDETCSPSQLPQLHVPNPSTPLNEMDPNQFPTQLTLNPSAPPSRDTPYPLPTTGSLIPRCPFPAETHPIHFPPQQASYRGGSPADTP